MALIGWIEPALARSYLNCPTKKVVTQRGAATITIGSGRCKITAGPTSKQTKHIAMARSACNAARTPIQLYLTVQGPKVLGARAGN